MDDCPNPRISNGFRCEIFENTAHSRLRAINLYGTQITSAGLEHLMGLERLRLLLIADVKIEPAVVEKLRNKLPRLTVTDFAAV